MDDAPSTDEISALRAEIARLASEREHYHQLYLRALEQCRKLELGLLGQKAERLTAPETQLAMGAAPFRRRASHRTEMAFGPRRESLV